MSPRGRETPGLFSLFTMAQLAGCYIANIGRTIFYCSPTVPQITFPKGTWSYVRHCIIIIISKLSQTCNKKGLSVVVIIIRVTIGKGEGGWCMPLSVYRDSNDVQQWMVVPVVVFFTQLAREWVKREFSFPDVVTQQLLPIQQQHDIGISSTMSALFKYGSLVLLYSK